MMAKFKKRLVKWGLSAAKVGLAASIMMGVPMVSVQASEFEGFEGLDFGAVVQRGLEQSSFIWFEVGKPLKSSASPTTGSYNADPTGIGTSTSRGWAQSREYVTRTVGTDAERGRLPTDDIIKIIGFRIPFGFEC
jgi:hypothetical protein